MSASNATATLAPAVLDEAEVSRRRLRPGHYPPASTVSRSSWQRLFQATEAASSDSDPNGQAPETVLYLAYGSNMSASAFLGMRGIRPVSQINVSVPALRLTLGLRGMPYWEPCFANVGFREPPDKTISHTQPQARGEWGGRLIGVVYEVTQKDYRTIMSTESAGSSYREIMVGCIPIVDQEENRYNGQAFSARKLYAPDAKDVKDGPTGGWWHRLTMATQRPGVDGAQASARYMQLLKDGAREHGLPEQYQRYLASLQPYRVMHWQQRIGRGLMLFMWAPLLILMHKISGLLADETGRTPRWQAAAVNAVFNLMWMSYDWLLKPIFGDGERTQGKMMKGAEQAKKTGGVRG